MRLLKYLIISLIVHIVVLSLFSSNNRHPKPASLPVQIIRKETSPVTESNIQKREEKSDDQKGRLVFKPNAEPKDEKKKHTGPENPKKTISSKFKTRQDYESYLNTVLSSAKMEGIPVPDLCVTYYDVHEILDVIDYYGLKLLAFPDPDPKEQPYFVEVRDYRKDDFVYHRTFDFSGYSNRVKDRRGHPFFENIVEKLVQKYNLNKDTMCLVSLTPNKIDRYFEWKQVETAKRNSLNPKDIKITFGRYYKSNFGGWILVIDKLLLKNNQMFDVTQDFELKDISS